VSLWTCIVFNGLWYEAYHWVCGTWVIGEIQKLKLFIFNLYNGETRVDVQSINK